MPFDQLKETAFHVIPFLGLMSENAPENRPLLTRIIEQSFVGLISGAVSVVSVLTIHGERIDALREVVREERILTARERQELRERIERVRADLYIPKTNGRGN